MRTLTWSQVLAWRMERQFLLAPGRDAVTVARRLAGVQAQVASCAVTALAVRGAEPPDAALRDGRLLKSWAMRGTLHLLPTEDAGAYLALCGTVRNWEKPSWTKAFKATPADLEAIGEAASAVLSAEPLTREELTTAIVERTGSAHLEDALRSGWGSLLKPLSWWGVLCHGPSRGSRVTFVSPATLPGWRGLPPVEEAARTVLRAYLGAHGPASRDQFDAWLMRRTSKKSAVKEWFAALDGELTEVSVDGVAMYALTSQVDALAATEPTDDLRLLGGFDQYVLGAGTDSTQVVPPEHRTEVSRTAGWIAPVVLRGGRVAGTWDPETGEAALWEKVSARELAAAVRSFPSP